MCVVCVRARWCGSVCVCKMLEDEFESLVDRSERSIDVAIRIQSHGFKRKKSELEKGLSVDDSDTDDLESKRPREKRPCDAPLQSAAHM